MTKFLVKVKISKFVQLYIVTKRELDIIKQLDYYDEGTCCGQSRCFVCKMGGCRFKYIEHTEIDDESDIIVKFINGSSLYCSLPYLLDVAKEQDDYDDEIAFSEIIVLVNDKKAENVAAQCIDFYQNITKEELEKLDEEAHAAFFRDMIKHLTYDEYIQILDIAQSKMKKSLVRDVAFYNDEDDNMMSEILLKFGLSKLIRINKRFYGDDLSRLAHCEISLFTKEELAILKKDLRNYSSIRLKETKTQIMLEVD